MTRQWAASARASHTAGFPVAQAGCSDVSPITLICTSSSKPSKPSSNLEGDFHVTGYKTAAPGQLWPWAAVARSPPTLQAWPTLDVGKGGVPM